MEWSRPAHRRAFKMLAAASVPALLAFMLWNQPAHSQTPAAPAPAPAAAASLKLFPDSTLVPGERISVEVVGRGPDVVLIPGLASSRETWRHTAERLRGKYRLHLVQVAGFAGAPAGPNGSGPVIEPTKEAIDRYIVSAGLRKPAIVGHSLGGLMAVELGLDHPDHVGKVFVVDSLAFFAETAMGPTVTVEQVKPFAEGLGMQMMSLSPDAWTKNASRTGQSMASHPEDQARINSWALASDRATMVKAMQEDMTTDLRPRMATLKVPVTVIYEAPLKPLIEGDYGPAPQKTLVSAASGVKHFIMYDDPAAFDAAMDAFLAK